MRKTGFITLFACVLLFAGCAKNTGFSTSFDGFSLHINANHKVYESIPVESLESQQDTEILNAWKETIATWKLTTGFVNSLVTLKTALHSWTALPDLVKINSDALKQKLIKYVATTSKAKNFKCDDVRYSWYLLSFEYQLAELKLYDTQYFFVNHDMLYIISLSSDTANDNKGFVKGLSTLSCL